MPSFSREELEALLECFNVVVHCPTHGAEATRVCNKCTRFVCDECLPGPCQCWQEQLQQQMLRKI
jgi:hypothetical protein